tara:strand:- start:1414 stop:4062 length:2649 start_codon:yes stop_codon:yes gene_type:complete
MSDYLLHCAASNWLVSSVLAAFAWFAQSKLRRPVIAHLLWLLVLVKLVTPPLFSLAVLPAPAAQPAPVITTMAVAHTEVTPAMPLPEAAAATSIDATTMLLALWLLGSVIVLCWSTFRIVRFHRLLTQASRPANQDLVYRAKQLAQSLGLKKTPSINITSARVSPMVWWVGGKVRIFIPEAMPAELGANKMRWILAHELGHVRRGDHFVRWLEWLACVAFWWNPIAWLARRNLRANEEVCCDALVLRSLKGKPHSYANSLLAAVEFLASPGLRPPAMASEINSGGFLERRFRMIVSKTPMATTPRWLQAVLLLCTISVMPLGIAYAQNPDVGAVTKRLRKAVQAGELSPAEARKMLRTLKESNAQDPRRKKSKRQAEQEHYDRLVQSLKDGLRAGIESGQLTKEEARKLYERQMSHLKQDPAEHTVREIKKAQDKTFDMAELKRRLQRQLKNGEITTEQAKQRAAKWVEQQMAQGMELDVNTQSLRPTAAKLRSAEDKRRSQEAAKRDALIEQARRDLNEKAKALHKMQRDLAEAKALLEDEVQYAREVRVDQSQSRKKQERIKADKVKAAKAKAAKAKAAKVQAEWAKTDGAKAVNVPRIDFTKVQKARDLADQARAFDFSKRQQDAAERDLNRLRSLEAEAKERDMLMRTIDELRAKQLELEKRTLELQHGAEWRAHLNSAKKDAKASNKPTRVQLQWDTKTKPIQWATPKVGGDNKPTRVQLKWDTKAPPIKRDTKDIQRTWRGILNAPKDGNKKASKAEWDVHLNVPNDTIERLHAEQTKAADEVAHAKDLLQKRTVELQRVVDMRLDADKAEQLQRRAMKLVEAEQDLLRNTSEQTVREFTEKNAREWAAHRVAPNKSQQEAAKVRKESGKRRSVVR